MGGGLMQLVAYGAQDIYLTGNPQITFFKVVYRRHTNFAMESIEQTFNGSANFGQKVSCTVSRNGDLIHRVYLQVDLPVVTVTGGINSGEGTPASVTSFNWKSNLGHRMIDEVSIEIGGQQIDKHYGDWLNIWNELTQSAEKVLGYDNMIGADIPLISAATKTSVPANTASTSAQTLYIPLQFWFCRNPGLALPLIALQYHEVKFNVSFKAVSDLYTFASTDGGVLNAVPSLSNASLYVDYVYLDTDERRQFAQVQHEYLIEQVQFTGSEAVSGTSKNARLAFNHPVKELVWVMPGGSDQLDYSGHLLSSAKLQLNGHDRFSKRSAAYFNKVQPFQHHTSMPSDGVFVYSFALNPEQHQPSGTVNMSRIDNATLVLERSGAGAANLRVYAVNYNVLRIMAGMGGLAYSN